MSGWTRRPQLFNDTGKRSVLDGAELDQVKYQITFGETFSIQYRPIPTCCDRGLPHQMCLLSCGNKVRKYDKGLGDAASRILAPLAEMQKVQWPSAAAADPSIDCIIPAPPQATGCRGCKQLQNLNKDVAVSDELLDLLAVKRNWGGETLELPPAGKILEVDFVPEPPLHLGICICGGCACPGTDSDLLVA